MGLNFKKGMTLTEILIIVSILAILILLVTSYLRTQVFKSYDSRKKAEIKRIAIAVEEYEKDTNCYPTPNLVTCVNSGIGLRPYLNNVPCDPVSGGSYFYEHEDSICPKWYRLYTNLQNESDTDYKPAIGPNYAYSYEYSSPNAPDVVQGDTGIPGGGGEGGPQVNFYGCFSGVCNPILWNESRPGPECDPNFQNSTCYGKCVEPVNECQIWN